MYPNVPNAMYTGLGWSLPVNYNDSVFGDEMLARYALNAPPSGNPETGIINKWTPPPPGYLHVIDRPKISMFPGDNSQNQLLWILLSGDFTTVKWMFGIPFGQMYQNPFIQYPEFICEQGNAAILAIISTGGVYPTQSLSYRYRNLVQNGARRLS